jgi:hypothetical protein
MILPRGSIIHHFTRKEKSMPIYSDYLDTVEVGKKSTRIGEYFAEIQHGPKFAQTIEPYIVARQNMDELEALRAWFVDAMANGSMTLVSVLGPLYEVDAQSGKEEISSGIPKNADRFSRIHGAFSTFGSETDVTAKSIIALADQEARGIPSLRERMVESRSAILDMFRTRCESVEVPLLTGLDPDLWKVANLAGMSFTPPKSVVADLIKQQRAFYTRISGNGTNRDASIQFKANCDIRERAVVGYFVRKHFPQALVITDGPEILACCMKILVPDLPLFKPRKHPRPW